MTNGVSIYVILFSFEIINVIADNEEENASKSEYIR
jgi:hypothetical protein